MFKYVFVSVIFLFISTGFAYASGKKLKVAICQIECIDSDVSGNLVRIEEQVKEAAEKGAKAAFFPETALIGWVNPDAYKLAEPIPGKYTERIGEMAKKYNIMIGIGLCEKVDEKVYDSAVLIDGTGKILLKHRKINILSWLMDKPYVPGRKEDISAVDTPIGRIGILICADSFKEENLEIMRERKPDFVYIPYGWAAEKEEWPEHGFELIRTVQKAAMKIGAPVIGPDLVGEITHGPWTGRTYTGLSTAADGSGVMLIQGKYNKRDVIIFDIAIKEKR